MNYYQFHIGDYRRDTAHLSRLEHSIYRDLIDLYYLDEKPIPLETHWVSRRLRLGTEEEAMALKNVLSDFFELADDGFHHARIDADIAHYHKGCTKNRENGKKGGRPKAARHKGKNPLGSESVNLGSVSVPSGNPVVTLTNNQEPITNNQEKDKEDKSSLSGKPDDARELLQFLNKVTGKHYQPVKANMNMIQARLREYKLPHLKAMVAARATLWKYDDAMSQYLRPATLFNATKCAQYIAEVEVEDEN